MRVSLLVAFAVACLAADGLCDVVITGKAVDPGTREPVGGLHVTAMPMGQSSDDEDGDRLETTTDPEGHFELELPGGGIDYTVTVKDGVGHLYAGFTHLDEDKDLEGIAISSGAVLSGKVSTGSEGKPVADVDVVAEFRLQRVRCRHYVEAGRSRTAKDGTFEFGNLSPGEYRCRVESGDYAPQQSAVEVGEDFAYVELVLEPGCRITGCVLDSAGRPVADVKVSAGGSAEAVTDEEGRYALQGLAVGEHDLRVESDEYILPLNKVIKLECSAGDAAEKDLNVVRAGKLVVKLVRTGEGADELPSDLRLSLTKPRDWLAGHRYARAKVEDGQAELAGVAPGTFNLQVSGQGLVELADEVTITAGEVTTCEFEVKPVCVVVGRLVDGDGAGVKGARVTLDAVRGSDDESDSMAARVQSVVSRVSKADSTDEKGLYEVSPLEKGKYKVRVSHDDFMPLTRTVDVTVGTNTLGAWTLGAGLSIGGTVMEADGSPVEGIEVVVTGPDGADGGDRIHRRVDVSDGEFRVVGLAEGNYDVTFREEDGEALVGLDAVAAGTDDVFVSLAAKVEVAGVVVGPGGVPVAEAAIDATEAGDGVVRSWRSGDDDGDARSDADGHFTLTLRSGKTYAVQASKEPLLPGSTAVDLADSEEVGRITITLEKGCTIKGTVVRGSDGMPLEGLGVNVSSAGDSSPWGFSGMQREAGRTTDAEGRFEIEGAPKGIVVVSVLSSGEEAHVLASKRVNARPEQPTDVTIELAALGSIKGKVLSEEGTPTGGAHVTAMRQSPAGATVQLSETTDADGMFELDQLPAGQYVVMAFVQGGDDMDFRRMTAMAEVAGGQTAEVVLGDDKTAGGNRINGVVTIEGRPFGGGKLRLVRLPDEKGGNLLAAMMGGQLTTAVGEDGSFELSSVEPGEYSYWIAKAGQDDEGTDADSGAETYQGTVDIADEQAEVRIDIRGLAISGTVRDAQGRPLEEAFVMLGPADGSSLATAYLRRWVRTDEGGAFEMKFVLPGDYTLRVQHDDGALVREIAVADQPLQLDLDLPRGVLVSGKVENETGGGVRGASVVVASVAEGKEDVVGYGQVDEEGTFAIEPLVPPGEYKLMMGMEGYAIVAERRTIEEATEFDGRLTPGGKVEILVGAGADGGHSGRVITVKDSVGHAVLRLRNEEWRMGGFGPFGTFVLGKTDDTGKTVIHGLAPGWYRVQVEGIPGTTDVEVKALETATVVVGEE